MSWYLLASKPRQEERAYTNLLKQGYKCFLPKILVQKVKKGSLVQIEEPLFPRYLFINLNSFDDNWSPIRSTLGVSGMVKFGSQCPVIPDEIVAEVMNYSQKSFTSYFTKGEEIVVRSGPFKGQSVSFDSMDGEQRVMVFMEMCHKIHRISISLNELVV